MKALLFDFGGTLDTNGIHWMNLLHEMYKAQNILMKDEDIRKAFIYAEKKLAIEIQQQHSLLETINRKIQLQFDYFRQNKITEIDEPDEVVKKLANECNSLVHSNINRIESLLQNLKNNYKLALISNYYGNLMTVCRELNIYKYFELILDSTIVGYRKPDQQIFKLAIDRLNEKPSECYVIGDSYENDIAPAISLGCKTVWLKHPENMQSNGNADYVISSIAELNELFQNLSLNKRETVLRNKIK